MNKAGDQVDAVVFGRCWLGAGHSQDSLSRLLSVPLMFLAATGALLQPDESVGTVDGRPRANARWIRIAADRASARSKIADHKGMIQPMTGTSAARKRQEVIKPTYRHRELEWIETHVEQMRHLAGEWVVLEGEDLIAHGKNASRVVASARRKGIKVPFVFFVESPDAGPTAHFGL